MLVSVGPDQYLGFSKTPVPEDMGTTTIQGYPIEPPMVWGSERHFYDPTNGTISTGNIYRFSGGLKQGDLLQVIKHDTPSTSRDRP